MITLDQSRLITLDSEHLAIYSHTATPSALGATPCQCRTVVQSLRETMTSHPTHTCHTSTVENVWLASPTPRSRSPIMDYLARTPGALSFMTQEMISEYCGSTSQIIPPARRQHGKGQRPVKVMIPALIAFLGPVPQAITGRTECVAFNYALNNSGGSRCQFRHGTGYSASPTAPDVNEWSYPEATYTAQTPQQPCGGGSHERAAKVPRR